MTPLMYCIIQHPIASLCCARMMQTLPRYANLGNVWFPTLFGQTSWDVTANQESHTQIPRPFAHCLPNRNARIAPTAALTPPILDYQLALSLPVKTPGQIAPAYLNINPTASGEPASAIPSRFINLITDILSPNSDVASISVTFIIGGEFG